MSAALVEASNQELLPRHGSPESVASDAKQWPALVRWGLPLLVYGVVVLSPRLSGVSVEGWRTTALFAATMVAFALRPLSPAVVVLCAVAVLTLSGADGARRALAGYATPGVWLVLSATILSRALRESGLARRAALRVIRTIGTTSTRLAGALVLADVLLAGVIPSVTARNAGLVFPVGVGLAEFYESRPGPTAKRLGAFLILVLYQSSGVVCAMFLTGQASNVLAANMAQRTLGVTMSWSSWFVAGVVPAVVSFSLILAVVHRLASPSVHDTPQAVDYAQRELTAMGPLNRRELATLGIAASSCLLFATTRWHHLDLVTIALFAAVALIACSATSWSSVVGDRVMWDLFVWYGGLFSLAEALASSGTPAALASSISSALGGSSALATFVLASGAAFLAHYLFASITAQVLTMFLPLVMVLIHAGVPPAMACFGMAFAFNLSSGLTHYGATNGPILFAADYVSMKTWWRVGLVTGAVNLAVWLSIGLVWWKLIGLW